MNLTAPIPPLAILAPHYTFAPDYPQALMLVAPFRYHVIPDRMPLPETVQAAVARAQPVDLVTFGITVHAGRKRAMAI